MAWTPCGTKRTPTSADHLAVTVEIDVPAGASLFAVVGAGGTSHPPITAQVASQAPAYMDGGDTGFFTTDNMDERLFGMDCPAGLSAGDTVTINMTGAGQGSAEPIWASLFFVPGATLADLGVFA